MFADNSTILIPPFGLCLASTGGPDKSFFPCFVPSPIFTCDARLLLSLNVVQDDVLSLEVRG